VTPRLALAVVVVALAVAAPRARAADDEATAQARSHYEMGLRLFDVRDHEQALIEFQKANELKSRPAAVFMMAQCEYLLGRLKDARAHYERYVSESPDGEFIELAKDRIESIDKRQSTFVINTVPDGVTVRITPEGKPGPAVDGLAPNNFQVPRGRYRIDVTKPQYIGQTNIVEVDIAETKPLFFKLDPIPARLEIETVPPTATLYVNGNRARNPYRQAVVPGHYELFAEAPDHVARTMEFSLAPGEEKLVTGPYRLRLQYQQRSGRPELFFASALIGGFVGAGAAAAAIGKHLDDNSVSSFLLVSGGGVAGAVIGALVATPLVPAYIPDNRALFIIGGMWIGGAEGAIAGIAWRQAAGCAKTACTLGEQLVPGFVGSLPGLALGLTAGAVFRNRAPTYGRVALIQSATLSGAAVGGLVQMAAQWKPFDQPNNRFLDYAPGAFIGLNVGLATGLLGAYVPDQTHYGPSWSRVLLVDLAAGAGAVAGGVIGCVANVAGCLTAAPDDGARARSALSALVGGAVGLGAGLLLTRHFDDDTSSRPPPSPPPAMSATLLPIRAPDGGLSTGVGVVGSF
jgi:hypothetical protein